MRSVSPSPETSRAFAVCVDVAVEHGLDTSHARVLRDSTNVIVDFAPAPVIGRVSMLLGRRRGPEWLETEVAFAALARRMGASVTAPADLPPGPHRRAGLVVTFWERVPHDRAGPRDQAAAGRALRELHDAVAGFDGELPAFDRLDEVDWMLARLEPAEIGTPVELDTLRRAAAVARERVSALTAPARPIHGDAHLGNVLWTTAGPVWSDFENVCIGPIEYDLACLVFRERAHGGPSCAEALAAYGRHDRALLESLLPVLGVFIATWAIVLERRRGPGAVSLVADRVRYLRETLG